VLITAVFFCSCQTAKKTAVSAPAFFTGGTSAVGCIVRNTPSYFREFSDKQLEDKIIGSLVYPMVYFPAFIHGTFGGPAKVYKSGESYSPMLSIDPFNASGWQKNKPDLN
jgi:hypothetical protein